MARTSALHFPNTNSFSVLEDRDPTVTPSPSSSRVSDYYSQPSTSDVAAGVKIPCEAYGVLQEASANGHLGQGIRSTAGSSLAADFKKLQLVSPTREGKSIIGDDKQSPRRLRLRPAIGSQTFEPLASAEEQQIVAVSPDIVSPTVKSEHHLEPIQEEVTQLDNPENSKDSPLMQLPSNFPSLDDQIARHQAGQYDIRLSYPASGQPHSSFNDENEAPRSSKEKIIYGCNFVRRDEIPPCSAEQCSGIADTVFVIASPVALEDDELERGDAKVLVDQMSPMMLENHLTPQKQLDAAPGDGRPSLTPQGSNLSVNSVKSGASPSPRTMHIEDSVEALDKLEEELEAVDAVAHFGRVISPSAAAARTNGNKARQRPGVKRNPSNSANGPVSRPATMRVKSAGSRVSVGTVRSVSTGLDDRKPLGGSGAVGETSEKPSPARKVQRPASLAPPKPLAKSNRPRTMPTFELPGESVARRLKEQKEARLSMQVDPHQAAKVLRASLPQRAKSTKAPTRPTFELPGEAISRRKREEREAIIKAEQEEERKRREFKARPIRTSFGPNTLPRETAASRARQNKSQDENNARLNTSRRVSVAPGSSTLSMNGSPQSRGRVAGMPSSQVSRATSTSTGSVSGKRSTISAEDTFHQKLRGKEILQRDSQYTEDKERERREREVNAKIAREQAAERSRQLSREWAEKQRRKTQTHQPVNGSEVSPSG